MADLYQLVRVPPGAAEEKTHSPVRRLRDAAAAAGRVLHDNTATSKADAQRFSAVLATAPPGTTFTHQPTGYRFRIQRVSN